MDEWSVTAADCVFIGDGKTDQDAALAHGMTFIGVNGGASSFDPATADRVVDRLDDLLA